jgi:hypothetical protein
MRGVSDDDQPAAPAPRKNVIPRRRRQTTPASEDVTAAGDGRGGRMPQAATTTRTARKTAEAATPKGGADIRGAAAAKPETSKPVESRRKSRGGFLHEPSWRHRSAEGVAAVELLLNLELPDELLTEEARKLLDEFMDELVWCLCPGLQVGPPAPEAPRRVSGIERTPDVLLYRLQDLRLLRRLAEETIPVQMVEHPGELAADLIEPRKTAGAIDVAFRATDVEADRIGKLLQQAAPLPTVFCLDEPYRTPYVELNGNEHRWIILGTRMDDPYQSEPPFHSLDNKGMAQLAYAVYLLAMDPWRGGEPGGWRRLQCEGWGRPCGRWIITNERSQRRCARCKRRQQRKPEAEERGNS